MDAQRLGLGATKVIRDAHTVHVSPISVYEVAYKARLGKWPEILPHLEGLLADSQTTPASLTPAVAATAAKLDWAHRDPFDRLIAASAIELRCSLVSKDTVFDTLERMPGWMGRIWT